MANPRKKKSKPTEDRVAPPNVRELIRSRLSPIQRAFLDDPADRKIARCSRRAGKSYVDGYGMVDACYAHPQAKVVYFGLTAKSAKDIIWDEIIGACELLQIPYTYSESQQEIYINGGTISVTGADSPGIKDRFRGRKLHLVIVDECAFYAKIDTFIEAVLSPTLVDFGGALWLTSSPGILKKSLFYRADQGDDSKNWVQYHWTGGDNPFFQTPPKDKTKGYKNRWDEILHREVESRFKGDWNNPTFRREWLGEWAFDDQSLVYPLQAEHHQHKEPSMRAASYALGLNLSQPGVQGAVVVKYGDYTREVVPVKAYSFRARNLDELAAEISTLIDDYDIEYATVFLGDHSPKIIENFRSRYLLPLRPSKHEKLEYYQTLIATDMGNGYIRPLVSDCAELVSEWGAIVRDERTREEIPDQDTLLADAFYAVYLETYTAHLSHVKEEESEEDRMERQLMEAIRQEQEDMEDYYGPNY